MIDAVYLLVFSLVLLSLRPVCRPPRVLARMLSHEECDHIMGAAEGALKPSTVAQTRKLDERTRKSETAWLSKRDKIVQRIMRRLLKYCDRPTDNCESLQVVRYKPGGFYNPHHDAFKEKNPRMYTFLIALNDDYEGGATAFPRLQKEYRLKKGDVLLFDTLDNYGFRHSAALHGGKPVTAGEKWIANLWVHVYPYDTRS
jgi:predicted 2-oxoglutarate/Fe(II)-dependent dioxygenase YbiX